MLVCLDVDTVVLLNGGEGDDGTDAMEGEWKELGPCTCVGVSMGAIE